MKNFLLIVFLAWSAVCYGEESLDNLYEKDGVSFSVAANWSVTEDVELDGSRYLFVETNEDPILIVNLYENQSAPSLDEHIQSMAKQKEFWSGWGGRSKGVLSETQLEVSGQLISLTKNEFDVEVMKLLKVPHVQVFYSKSVNGKTVFVTLQSAKDELDIARPAFIELLETLDIR